MSCFEIVKAVTVVDIEDPDPRRLAGSDADSVPFVLLREPFGDRLGVGRGEVLPSVERRPLVSWHDRHDSPTSERILERRFECGHSSPIQT